jgi:hypothetical protein
MDTCINNNGFFDVWSSKFSSVEFADDQEVKRAILTIPLMHVGPNKKGLYWTSEMLKKIAPMFSSVTFKYDLDGKEGSSHVKNKLFSPHFDVGWTTDSWYDSKTKILWVKGEVTHPDVLKKLQRQTSDGKREVNYASMGVFTKSSKCSICGHEHAEPPCEHERMEKYGDKICYAIPVEVSKALHVALVNDPADGEADIKECIFQEMQMGPNMTENGFKGERGFRGINSGNAEVINTMTSSGMAPGYNTKPEGEVPSSEETLRILAERIKTIEMKMQDQAQQNALDQYNTQNNFGANPEVINGAPQDQFTQDNMGTTTSFDEEQNSMEEEQMNKKDAQNTNDKTDVNPKSQFAEDGMCSESEIVSLLRQILARLPATEVQDMGKESLSVSKGQAQKVQEDIPTEHEQPGDSVSNHEDESNTKNKNVMQKPDQYQSADNSDEFENFKQEFADMKAELEELRKFKPVFQDSDNYEFGGAGNTQQLETADMRDQKYGAYGKWDACFNGGTPREDFKK